MIRYALKCDRDHAFDSWFQSAAAFDRLRATGLVACTQCGSTAVAKALMAPAIRHAGDEAPDRPLSRPAGEIETALAVLRRQIEENSEYVGLNFAAEARAIHDGDSPSRSIYGEARTDEARRLIEDGVPVAPLPFLPRTRTN